MINNSKNTETILLDWRPLSDIDMSDAITRLKVIADKNTRQIKFLLIGVAEGIKRYGECLRSELINKGAIKKDHYYLKIIPEKLTNKGVLLILQKLKSNGAPDEVISDCKMKLGCSIMCEIGLSSKNIHCLFSGYIRNIQTKIEKNTTIVLNTIPDEIQSMVISYGLPKHK